MKKNRIASSLAISLVLSSLAFSLLAVNPVSAESMGIKYAGTAVDDSSVGTLAWTNLSSACANDSNAAYFGFTSGTSHYLKLANFSFSIPTYSVITGIVVYIRHQARASFSYKDATVKLVQDGNPSGANRANSTWWAGLSWETFTYGSSSDLWGLNWTVSQINSMSFGVVLSANYTGSGVYGWVDCMSIRVYYISAPTIEIDHPLDISYTYGTTGHNITWTPSSIVPSRYLVYKGEVQQCNLTWNGNPITYIVDGLSPKVYNFTITVYDSFSRTVSDTVQVTVHEPPSESALPVILIIGGVAVAGLAGVAVALVKLKKK